MGKRRGKWRKNKMTKPLTWVVMVALWHTDKLSDEADELVHVEVDEYVEALAQGKAISVMRDLYPNAKGFQIRYTTPLDAEGKPLHRALAEYKPTKMVVGDEIADLEGGSTALVPVSTPAAADKASTKGTYKSAFPLADPPIWFTDEAVARMADKLGVTEYDQYNDVIVKPAASGGN